MPTIFIINGYRFYFYSNENQEPIHVHIEKAEATAKYWILPKIQETYSYGFSIRERKEIKKIIVKEIETIKKAWNEHFQ